MHHERFNQPDFLNGFPNCFVAANIFLRVFYLPHRKNNCKRKPDFSHLEPDFCVTHAASLYLSPSLDHKYFGIVKRDSARRRFAKFSSPTSLLNAVTMKTSLASQILAFRIKSFCFWL